MEDSQPQPQRLVDSPVSIPLGDRWQIRHRLEELGIACNCLPDGSFFVRVNTPLEALQLWSVVRQFTTPRRILAESLERCW